VPCAGKLACTALRGEHAGKGVFLPDSLDLANPPSLSDRAGPQNKPKLRSATPHCIALKRWVRQPLTLKSMQWRSKTKHRSTMPSLYDKYS
jgi:hypothetical protein